MNNRIKYCVANLKMNLFGDDVKNYMLELDKLFDKSINKKLKTIIFPSIPSLKDFHINIKNDNYLLGVQNIHHKECGSFTGEVSIKMISQLIEYVLIGHSERRKYFFESNELINKKICNVINHKLKPILCIGESLDERKNNNTEEILNKQLTVALNNINENLIIAYEPIWAIGVGETASSKIVKETHSLIRSILNDIGFDGEKISILYGGSVNRNNAKELIALNDVDGFLIGGASLDVKHFYDIYNFIEESN